VNTLLSDDSPEVSDGRVALASQNPLGFVLLWSRDEPDRVGEVTFVPSMEAGAVATLGRAESAPGDEIPRMEWLRQQPGHTVATGPLRSVRISRTQLQVEVHGPRTLRLINIGQRPMMYEGLKQITAIVSAGDMVELRGVALLLCVQRPRDLPVADPPVSLHPFGMADAHGIVGESPAAWELRARVAFVAGRDAHVLVRGPSGTGKELVAQAIHRLSSRGQHSMISRNAATFPETLIDAELFGNARNFPNPGMPERSGLIGEADQSTLFLDEFAELPQSMQAHLLRVLDAGEYARLGESRPRRADFRLIAATNRPETALKDDVLARLRLRLTLCGLDQRREDIPLIASHILRSVARKDTQIAQRYFPEGDPDATPRMSAALVVRLVRHVYATHVRELEALLWLVMTHVSGDTLDIWSAEVEPAPPKTTPRQAEANASARTEPEVDPLSIPPEVIQECLDRHHGRQDPVWRELGLSSRHVLARLIRRYGLRVGSRS
jgi:DNA-binding NtrC family response regulator